MRCHSQIGMLKLHVSFIILVQCVLMERGVCNSLHNGSFSDNKLESDLK